MFGRKHKRVRAHRGNDVSTMWRHIAIGVFVCVMVLVGVTGVWYGTRLPVMSIASVEVTGGDTIPHKVVYTYVTDILDQSYFSLVPHRFAPLAPTEQIAQALQAIPRVKDVSLTRDGATLRVAYTEYEPFALWCNGSKESGTCFFLDERGYAFAHAPQLEGATLVRHIDERVSTLDQSQAFETVQFERTHQFLENLVEKLELRVTDVRYTIDGDLEFTVSGGGVIKVSASDSYEIVLDRLSTVLRSDAFDHIEPGNFQYIDLRFGNKVFVNEEKPVVPTTTEDTVATTT